MKNNKIDKILEFAGKGQEVTGVAEIVIGFDERTYQDKDGNPIQLRSYDSDLTDENGNVYIFDNENRKWFLFNKNEPDIQITYF